MNFKKSINLKSWLAIPVAILLCSFIVCCGGNSILNKAWNFEVGANPRVVVVKLTGEVSRDWADSLETAMNVRNCKTVVMWIESPGGSVNETQILEHRIELLKQQYHKELIVYSEEWMMSGAYWTACEADKIIVSPVGLTGSIGVYMQRVDVTKLDSMMGVKVYTFRSGGYKNMGDPHMPMTEAEMMFWMNYIHKSYVDFITQIVVHRYNVFDSMYTANNGTKADSSIIIQGLLNICDGRFYTANEALNYGLIDNIMWLNELLNVYHLMHYDVVNSSGEKF